LATINLPEHTKSAVGCFSTIHNVFIPNIFRTTMGEYGRTRTKIFLLRANKCAQAYFYFYFLSKNSGKEEDDSIEARQ